MIFTGKNGRDRAGTTSSLSQGNFCALELQRLDSTGTFSNAKSWDGSIPAPTQFLALTVRLILSLARRPLFQLGALVLTLGRKYFTATGEWLPLFSAPGCLLLGNYVLAVSAPGLAESALLVGLVLPPLNL